MVQGTLQEEKYSNGEKQGLLVTRKTLCELKVGWQENRRLLINALVKAINIDITRRKMTQYTVLRCMFSSCGLNEEINDGFFLCGCSLELEYIKGVLHCKFMDSELCGRAQKY